MSADDRQLVFEAGLVEEAPPVAGAHPGAEVIQVQHMQLARRAGLEQGEVGVLHVAPLADVGVGQGAGRLVLGEVLVQQGGDALVLGAEEQHALVGAQCGVHPVEQLGEELLFTQAVQQGQQGARRQAVGRCCGVHRDGRLLGGWAARSGRRRRQCAG